MSNYDTSNEIDPVTNNIRRIFRERGFRTQKEMALFLGEDPFVFSRYIWCGKRQMPSYDKLKRWAEILETTISEFFVIREEEPWPYRPPKAKTERKAGIGYRRSMQIRNEIVELLPNETIMSHDGLRYLYNRFATTHPFNMKYDENSLEDSALGMVADDISRAHN